MEARGVNIDEAGVELGAVLTRESLVVLVIVRSGFRENRGGWGNRSPSPNTAYKGERHPGIRVRTLPQAQNYYRITIIEKIGNKN